MPPPSVVAEPTEPSTELINVTVLLASAVPVNVGVVSLVKLSVLELPVSEAVARSGVPGAAGDAESMVTASADDAAEVLPAVSVAVAVML